jgi:beta-phosphoglucomutase family hydrolase
LFDLDGVLTNTAGVHDKAWTEMFDAFLRERAEQTGGSFVAFDPSADYSLYVDGKPRPDGVRDFLASRGIRLPEGSPDDGPGVETVHGLGNRKNEALLRWIREEGVEVFEGSRRYLEAARDAGLRRVVVSSSANTAEVLEVTGLVTLVEGWIDGLSIADQGLKGKPAPDTFLARARCVGVDPPQAAVFEDALAGVAAGRQAPTDRESRGARFGSAFRCVAARCPALRFVRDHVRTDRQWLAGADVPQGGA